MAREAFNVTIDENGTETVYTVSPIWADNIATEKHFRDHKLGKLEENPITAATVLTFSALKRTGKLPAETAYNTFESLVVNIEANEVEDAPKS